MTGLLQYCLEKVRIQKSSTFTLAIDRLEIAQGEILCIVGPTGAGKSTLLRVLTGLDSIDSGSVEFHGRRWSQGVAPLNNVRMITLVPQLPIILRCSVRANVEYGLRLRGFDVRDQVDQVLKRLRLEHLADQPGRTLSGGERQLVALARALVLQPQVLLLDEPTANLDPTYVGLIEDVLQELRVGRSTTIVCATHNLHQARRIADRASLILNGDIVESGLVDDFFQRPRDPRTAAFVQGKMVC